MSMQTFLTILSYVGLALQCMLLIFLIKTKTVAKYKLFFYYTLFVVMCYPLGLYFYYTKHPTGFFIYYYGQDAISIGLALGVQRDTVYKIFEEYEGIRRFGLRLFYGALVVLTVFAASTAYAFVEHQVHPETQFIFRVETTLRSVQVGLVVFLMFFMRTLALVWKREYFGIALGFGIYASTNLFYYLCKMQYGVNLPKHLGDIITLSYFCAQLIWLIAFLIPPNTFGKGKLPDFSHLEKWNALLSRIKIF